jgi:O-acetyl-ADP-ribose deacetylase (regulator of RNase III)
VCAAQFSSGSYGYPKADAFRIADAAVRDFISENNSDVILAIFGWQ